MAVPNVKRKYAHAVTVVNILTKIYELTAKVIFPSARNVQQDILLLKIQARCIIMHA